MPLKLYQSTGYINQTKDPLSLNTYVVIEWLTKFLKDECIRQRGITRAVLGLSGGLDSTVVAYLCVKAFGPKNVYAFSMPFKTSATESFNHAKLVAEKLTINFEKIDISSMIEGYTPQIEQDISDLRLGNLCARCRAMILFDQSAKLNGLPIGTGNKSERLMGYYTWHADDSPPVNPLGDLYKTQVFEIAKELKVPEVILNKAPSADLVSGQTDEKDLGLSYLKIDNILYYLLQGYTKENLSEYGFEQKEVEVVLNKLQQTHWKRRLPTVAMLDVMAIGESYLRPVDYC